MAKIQLYLFVLAVLLTVGYAATKQEGLFNCAGAKQLGKDAKNNNCCQLCRCLAQQSGNKAFNAASIQAFCKDQCLKCVAAANNSKQCPKADSALPEACSKGLAFTPIIKNVMNKCAAMYERDPSALRKVPGC